MGKLRWVPLLILMALLATDALAAETTSELALARHPRASCDVIVAPSGDTGSGGYGGLQGDPDDLIDGNRAKPKPGYPGLTGTGTGSSLSTVIISLRLYSVFMVYRLFR